MGKYMKKGKISTDLAVMDLSQSPLGVRTRAKTLALQRLQSAPSSPATDSESCYLQLRSRRLQKHTAFREHRKKSSDGSIKFAQEGSHSITCQKWNLESSSRFRAESSSVASASITLSDNKEGCLQVLAKGCEAEEGCDFGENNLEFEPRDRSARESTPSSLIREEDTIKTPSSTTKTQRMRSSVLTNVPSAEEIDEFFGYAEQQQQQQRLFVEKYNFDIVNDVPLPGRYEWVRVSQ